MIPPVPLRSPDDSSALTQADSAYLSESGRSYPIIDGIPRFVPDEAYAAAFGAQWLRF